MEDNKKKFPVTILMPAYNEELSIGETIRRARELYPDYEILVVDDGSTDNSLYLIEQFKTGTKENVIINDIGYACVKIKNNDETVYIFFSDKLKQEQLEAKGRKFEKELKKLIKN